MKRNILVISLIIFYFIADILMDIYLFPMMNETLQEHHKTIVTKNTFFFALIPVWIIGTILFEKLKKHWAVIICGSALAASVIFAFTSLPFIWIASTFPDFAPAFLFLHDYGIYLYFFIIIAVLLVLKIIRHHSA